MKARKILCMLIAMMTAASLAACGTGSESGSANTGNGGASASTEGEASGDSVTSFDVVCVRWTESWGTDYSETAFLKEAEETAGVDIVWDSFWYADWAEQKSLLLASGDLPDAFFGSICLTDSDVSQNKASLYELTDLIAENMPNLSAILNEDATMKSICTDPQGDIYTLPKKLPLRPVTANQMYINTDFLSAVGMEMPQTYEELANFMIAVAQEDPDGNGQADTFGTSNAATCADDLNNLLLPFGVQASRVGNYMSVDAQGNPYFVPTSENFKEAVKWANYLYANGGLDPERFTMDASMEQAKVQADGGSKVGVVWQWSRDAETGGNAAQFALCEAVEGPDGERYVESDPTYLNYGRRELVVTKLCKDPAKLLQWADLFYTDLASVQTYYGSIGDGKIAEKEDGTYEVLIPSDGMSLDTSNWTYSFRDHGPKYMSIDFESKIVLPTDQGDGAKLIDNEIDKDNIHDTFPVCSYTDEQQSNLTLLTTDIYNYVQTTYADWVVNGGIDEGWDAYIEQL
ncbi:MAG: hypothetical protein IIV88_00385 [Erysipelotrichaceae bacterium]|nr:hypothetical protein [Erysipelotrichaceae bacterium]